MTTASVIRKNPSNRIESFAHDLGRAFGSPRHAVGQLRRWTKLAWHAELPVVELLRYRRELLADDEFQDHLERCLPDVPYIFPEAVELYALIRALKPAVVVETGVASGRSSAHILRALDRNGSGALHSIDLPNVQEGSVLPIGRSSGWIVPDSLRNRWKLQLGDSRELLPLLLNSLGRVDVFLHDSDHSYEAMLFEFEQAYPSLAPGGLLLSDDTHLHAAWDDFCKKHHIRPGRVGHLGLSRKPREATA